MFRKFFIAIFFLYPIFIGAQNITLDQWVQADSVIAALGNTLLTDRDGNARLQAKMKIDSLLGVLLADQNTFKFPFKKATFLSVQTPSDSSFRIITAQHFVNDNEYRYIGKIQLKNGGVIHLEDKSKEIDAEQYALEELNQDEWYGALYYNIFDAKLPQDNYYLLLGFNGFEFFNKRKIIDVLWFDEDNKAIFGKDVFVPDSTLSDNGHLRFIYTYSADVAMKLNYDPIEGMIVLDHLIPMRELFPGQGNTFVPDGSNEGFYFKKGKWHHVSVLEQKPLDNIEVVPLMKDKNKDILGRQKPEKKPRR